MRYFYSSKSLYTIEFFKAYTKYVYPYFMSANSKTKKALIQNPKYVTYKYRKEQLWGEKLQYSTEKLFEINELQEEVLFAKSKIDKSS